MEGKGGGKGTRLNAKVSRVDLARAEIIVKEHFAKGSDKI